MSKAGHLVGVPDILAGLTHLDTKKYGDDKEWARALTGQFGYGQFSPGALEDMARAIRDGDPVQR